MKKRVFRPQPKIAALATKLAFSWQLHRASTRPHRPHRREHRFQARRAAALPSPWRASSLSGEMTAVAASNNNEELILELFDVLERCPAAARDAATDAALEAIAAGGRGTRRTSTRSDQVRAVLHAAQVGLRPLSGRPARPVGAATPELEPMQLNEKMRLTWAGWARQLGALRATSPRRARRLAGGAGGATGALG